jgi:hypothetical protein
VIGFGSDSMRPKTSAYGGSRARSAARSSCSTLLHTTRTGAELGRYESPELTSADKEEFLNEFGRFFCEDSRHDLWVRSHDDDATIVLDRHNLIYAYGPLDAFEAALQSLGARKGEPAVLGAHVHHYHPAWDEAERRILRSFEWDIKPLRPSAVQFDPDRDCAR